MIPYLELFNAKIYLYPFLMGSAWGIGYHLSRRLNEKYHSLKKYNILFFIIFVSAWLGGKVFYLLTVDIRNKSEIAQNSNFWMGGGFVFYGGLIFAILAMYLCSRVLKFNWANLNIFIPSLLIGHGIGRIGCFFAGCCYGIEMEKEVFFSIHLHGAERFPVQLLESTLLLLMGLYFYKTYRTNQMQMYLKYLIGYSLIRLTTEFFRGDDFRGIWFDLLSTSQIISMIIFALSLTFFVIGKNKY